MKRLQVLDFGEADPGASADVLAGKFGVSGMMRAPNVMIQDRWTDPPVRPDFGVLGC